MSDRIKGSALTMGGAACWGVSGCMGQYLFTREGMDSTWLVPIRLFLAGLILCGFFLIKDRKTLFDPWNVRKNPRNAIDLLVYGLAGVSCCQFTYFLTIQLSSAGMGTILQDVSPVIILLVVCIQQKRGPRVFEVCSILLALVGVFLITTHGWPSARRRWSPASSVPAASPFTRCGRKNCRSSTPPRCCRAGRF